MQSSFLVTEISGTLQEQNRDVLQTKRFFPIVPRPESNQLEGEGINTNLVGENVDPNKSNVATLQAQNRDVHKTDRFVPIVSRPPVQEIPRATISDPNRCDATKEIILQQTDSQKDGNHCLQVQNRNVLQNKCFVPIVPRPPDQEIPRVMVSHTNPRARNNHPTQSDATKKVTLQQTDSQKDGNHCVQVQNRNVLQNKCFVPIVPRPPDQEIPRVMVSHTNPRARNNHPTQSDATKKVTLQQTDSQKDGNHYLQVQNRNVLQKQGFVPIVPRPPDQEIPRAMVSHTNPRAMNSHPTQSDATKEVTLQQTDSQKGGNHYLPVQNRNVLQKKGFVPIVPRPPDQEITRVMVNHTNPRAINSHPTQSDATKEVTLQQTDLQKGGNHYQSQRGYQQSARNQSVREGISTNSVGSNVDLNKSNVATLQAHNRDVLQTKRFVPIIPHPPVQEMHISRGMISHPTQSNATNKVTLQQTDSQNDENYYQSQRGNQQQERNKSVASQDISTISVESNVDGGLRGHLGPDHLVNSFDIQTQESNLAVQDHDSTTVESSTVGNTGTSRKKPSLMCKYCNTYYDTWSAFQEHDQKEHTTTECWICQKQYSKHWQLIRHVRTHTGEKPFKCDHCSLAFPSQKDLDGHRQRVVAPSIHKCNQCEKSFKCKSTLANHVIQKHSTEKPFKCPQCDKSFKLVNQFNNHFRIHTGEKPYGCNACDKVFRRSSDLVRHKRTHSGEKPHCCEYCQKRFLRKSALNKHIKIHTGQDLFRCEYCPYVSVSKDAIGIHTNLHTGAKPYECPQCPKKFSQPARWKIHINSHAVVKPFQCTYCDKGFIDGYSLKRHVRTHTGEKPYKCTHCDKSFAQGCQLQFHERTHTGEKPYECTECEKKFTRRQELNKHLQTHEKQKNKRPSEINLKPQRQKKKRKVSSSSDSDSDLTADDDEGIQELNKQLQTHEKQKNKRPSENNLKPQRQKKKRKVSSSSDSNSDFTADDDEGIQAMTKEEKSARLRGRK